RGDAAQGQQKQRDAAAALGQLAQPRPAARRVSGGEPPTTPEGLPSKTQVDKAQQLAKEQRELREAVQKLTQQATARVQANQPNPVGELARQQERIAEQTRELAQQIAREQGEQSSPTKTAEKAADHSSQASKQMQSGAVKPASEAGQKTAAQLRQLAKQLG